MPDTTISTVKLGFQHAKNLLQVLGRPARWNVTALHCIACLRIQHLGE